MPCSHALKSARPSAVNRKSSARRSLRQSSLSIEPSRLFGCSPKPPLPAARLCRFPEGGQNNVRHFAVPGLKHGGDTGERLDGWAVLPVCVRVAPQHELGERLGQFLDKVRERAARVLNESWQPLGFVQRLAWLHSRVALQAVN